MDKIGLVTDEGVDFTPELIKQHQIEVVNFQMDWPDLEKLPGENTFQKMRELEKRGIKSFGKTSQPSPKAFLDAYKKQLEKFEKVLCMTITSKLSGTYNSAIQAKNILGGDRVEIVDSLNATCGEGLLALKAIDEINQGKDIKEIIQALEKNTPKIHLYGFVADPKWLEASGRISHAITVWIKNMQKIGVRPVLGVKKGLIKPIGLKSRAKDLPAALFDQLKRKTEKERKKGKKIRVAITHGDNLKETQILKEMIEKEFKEIKISFVNLIDNVLGILVGPDALVLAWMEV